MRISLQHLIRSKAGSLLVGTVVTVAVIGTAVAAVLTLVTQEHRQLTRAADWNTALPLAEAGLEEAMSHLRKVDGGVRAANGWTLSGTNFVLSRTLTKGSYGVAISPGIPPIITSTGRVWSVSHGNFLQRRIQARTKGQGLFVKGLVAKGKITMSGQVTIDSFDSTDPVYSTNGTYTVSKRKDNGDVATNLSTPDAMDIGGQVKIYGRGATGPAGTIKISDPNQQALGTAAFINGGGKGIQAGRYTKDMNVSFPDVTEPFAGGGFAPVTTVPGYKYVISAGNHSLSTLSLSGSDKLLVTGTATLYVDQDVSISGGGAIQIAPGANLQLYVKKGAVSISGQGVINQTANASNFSLFGMPEMKDINLSGDGQLVGTMYAPQAKLSMSGGSTSGLDFTGAAVVNEVNASGQYKFHYDEALANAGAKNLTIVSWKEI